MTVPLLNERIRPMHIYMASLILVLLNITVNLFAASPDIQYIFNTAFGFTLAFIVSIVLMVLYHDSKKSNEYFTRTLFYISLSMVSWTIGDSIWLVLLSQNIDPFISAADIFYILASIVLIFSLFTIPGSQQPALRRKMILTEISIIVLSAIVIFAALLLVPGKPDLNYDPLDLLMVFIYPVLDIILIWIIMIRFFTNPVKSIQKILGILLVGAGCIFFSDFLYLVNSLYKPLMPNYLADIGYYFFYSSVLLAGISGYRKIRSNTTEIEHQVSDFNAGNWIVFLPGIFLSTVIVLLLVFVLNNTFNLFYGIVVLLSIIIILFIVHQYLVIADNIKLARGMKLINAQLESKVELRTAELIKANKELQAEMQERRKAENQLAGNNQELALLNRDKDTLFTILAHDLRSPLGSIMKLSELLVESFNDFDENELREVILALNKSSAQTFQLLNDLLSWATVQIGSSEGRKEVFVVLESISGKNGILTSEAALKNIGIQYDIDPSIVVFADKFAFQTILRNLLSNAVKFTPENGKVIVKAEKSDKMVTISVIDSGIGMPEEKLNKIFRIDRISSSPGTAGEKGTGFGLLLCKDLVGRNGGEIWLTSEESKGSSFHFTLPVSQEESLLQPVPHEAAKGRIELKYDHSRKLGFSTFTGEFDQNTMKTELFQIWKRSDYETEYSLLIDLRDASFNLVSKDYQDILGIFTDLPGKRKNKKFALLTTTPQQVAFSTIFSQHMKNNFPLTVEVFSTYEAAVSWLG